MARLRFRYTSCEKAKQNKMSSFKCDNCGTDCIEYNGVYITGCEHYMKDFRHRPRRFGSVLVAGAYYRHWEMDGDGVKRWVDDGSVCTE